MIMDKSAIVWCQVDPKKVADLRTLIYEDMNEDQNGLIQNSNSLYDHKFAQAGNKLKVIKTCAYTIPIAGSTSTTPVTLPAPGTITYTLDTDTFTCTSLTIIELKCSSYGYKVNPSIMEKLTSLFSPSKPFIIPGEFVDRKKFSQGSDGSCIDTDFSYALHNCTDAILAFPKDSTSITCYENPMLKNLQLTIDGKLYPVKSIETVGERFFNMTLTASNLDERDECTEEYEDSLTRPLNDDSGARFARTWTKQALFVCMVLKIMATKQLFMMKVVLVHMGLQVSIYLHIHIHSKELKKQVRLSYVTLNTLLLIVLQVHSLMKRILILSIRNLI